MPNRSASRPEDWPNLAPMLWDETRATLHMWTQIIGKIRLAQAPMINHWLQVPLYVTSREVASLYRHPELLWAIVPLTLYWVARIWLAEYRGLLREDPLLFTLRDGPSWAVLAGMLLAMAAAK